MADERAQKVVEIERGRRDYAGERILGVYSYNPPEYAIYRTSRRLLVQFSDDPAVARTQRANISVLAPLRGQINGLVDGWRGDVEESGEAGADAKRAERYDRRVADAVLMVLEDPGQATTAIALLTEIKDDVVSERQSLARVDYLLFALFVTSGFVLLMWIASWSAVGHLLDRLGPTYGAVWTGVAGGAIGAFLSIASAIKKRTVLVNLRQLDNRADAALRVTIGAISGGMLICLLASKLIATPVFVFEPAIWLQPSVRNVLLIFVLGFLAGFAERLLPDLLEKAQLGVEQKESPVPSASAPSATAAIVAAAAAQTAANPPPAPPPASPAPPAPEEPPADAVDDPDAPPVGAVDDPDAADAGGIAIVDDPDAPPGEGSGEVADETPPSTQVV